MLTCKRCFHSFSIDRMKDTISRRWELDALRGLMLVMMFTTHLPTRYSNIFGQSFGFVSAAEGFVMLSAFMAGMVYTRKAQRDGVPAMRRAFFRRTLTVYAWHVGCLLLLFTVIAALGLKFDQPGLKSVIDFYLRDPVTALWASVLLIYNPPLLDILPLYVMLLLAGPWLLARGMQRGWRGIFLVSILLWVAAQFDISAMLYAMLVAVTGLTVPFHETGAFETYAWQLLWVLGLWLGSMHAQGKLDRWLAFSPKILGTALVIVVVFFVWRHAVGQAPFPDHDAWNRWLFDKWHLAPLRLLNFLALAIVLQHFGQRIAPMLPRLRFFESMGAASLPVFCMHLLVVLVIRAVLGDSFDDRTDWDDAILLIGGVLLLYLVAYLATGWRNRFRR